MGWVIIWQGCHCVGCVKAINDWANGMKLSFWVSDSLAVYLNSRSIYVTWESHLHLFQVSDSLLDDLISNSDLLCVSLRGKAITQDTITTMVLLVGHVNTMLKS